MRHFDSDEFQCSCGCGADITQDFKILIGKARALADTPFIIKSGARCKDHNKAIGGKDTSSHTVGLAVDIRATGSRKRSLIISAFCQLGVSRFGIDENFIHVDVDNEKDQDVIWLYS